ncbi:hypothetical protein TrRE_jg8995 [Triparma retinervis]|jgi:hypothetical protein|uniref:Uncharacterized protein n=1 Tax=Triparma retinervis TaxID=2557542 RepID=A0A9W7FVI4_9STRA|nr:hypothetical protein TrRE_jg8995 [Triparma retinervis]
MKIVNAILEKLDDIHVKLMLNSTETSWEKHGEIAIKMLLSADEDGEMVEEDILYVEDYQHNKRYSEMNSRAKDIADNVREYVLTRKRGESGETASLTDEEK